MRYLFDTTYILVLIGLLISMLASWNVRRTFKKYSKYGNLRHVRAEQVAQTIM